MRQIKFRGKRKDTGEWVHGDLQLGDGDHIPMIGEVVCGHDPHYVQVEEDTIGQFTGLYDKNGSPIYEGDIIGCHNPDIKHLIFYEEKQGRFIAALNGDIENSFIGVCGLDSSRWNALKEVIGNIHDNPELLKGGTK